ncbi:hypothetical protein [Pseudomonas caricapapayae]|uniref:Uncharacterized protein n=1 Tax=Pseudomonas caricapapayae TaxID=46678 RepID=A0A3M6GVA0_9PSED|nr:hypothetical protein [Pseudomonas caricapapayae]KAA8690095.1 hypothetical protein F4W67_27050 [Pseudomonas caricapapayae]RMM11929.1 hypothetical protein ALQ84_200015 [Pseudomonas caricapapayae]RMV96404.1 hypothetical protein ALP01_200527 [Pseudomonas caricapapayae]
MQTYKYYPKNPPTFGTVLLTSYGLFAHVNEILLSHIADVLRICKEVTDGFDDEKHHLRALMLMIADVPEEPLLNTSAAHKGSIIAYNSLGYLLSCGSIGENAKRIIQTGNSVFLVELNGTIDNPTVDLKVFNSWPQYQKFLRPILSMQS